MAGRGPAPKPPEQRRRYNQPARNEWVELKPLGKPALGALPRRTAHEGPWSSRTKAAWAAWRQDPATGMYGPAEIQAMIDLAYVYERWVRDETAALAAELRQRQDILGLSPKGKQDRRWRPPSTGAVEEPAAAKLAEVRRLRVVAPDAKG